MYQTKLAIASTLIALIILAIPITLYLTVDQPLINQLLAQYSPNTKIEIILLFVVSTLLLAIGLPRQIAAFTYGLLFETMLGALLATCSAIIACVLTFHIAQKLLHEFVKHRYQQKLAIIEQFFLKDTFQKALIIRLIPAGSNFLTNVLAGTAKAPFKAYLLGTALGFLPQMTLFAMLGAGIKVGEGYQITLSILLLLLAAILSVKLKRKYDIKALTNVRST